MPPAAIRRWVLLAAVVMMAAMGSGASSTHQSVLPAAAAVSVRSVPAIPVVALPARVEAMTVRRAPAGGPEPALALAVLALLAWMWPLLSALARSMGSAWSSRSRRRYIIGVRAPPALLFT
jgi:hypothetical protein